MDGVFTINDLDNLIKDCRDMANSLGLMISWKIEGRTGTVFLKFNHHILWQNNYTDKLPHMIVIMMYSGLYNELYRRQKENNASREKMRQQEIKKSTDICPFDDNGRYRRKPGL